MRAAGPEVLASVSVLVVSLAVVFAARTGLELGGSVLGPIVGLVVVYAQALLMDESARALTRFLGKRAVPSA